MRCIICDQERPGTKEDIFPLAIGGCLSTLRVCGDCNSILGTRVDAPLVDHLAIVQRREVLKIKGRGKIPSAFNRILGKSVVLASDKTHRLRISTDPSTNKLDIRTVPNISKVVLPDGRVADQLRLDVRDIDKAEIVRKIRERRGLPPLTDDELDKRIADAEANAIENINPEVIANIRCDPVGYMKCLVKIAYELAFCWLGEEYLDDPVAKGTRGYLIGIMNARNTTNPVLPMKGTVSFDVIDTLKTWSNNKNLHVAYAIQFQGSVVVSIKIFDIFYATFVVSDIADKYLARGLSDQKLRFLAIDPVTRAMAETSFMEEVGRIASIMTGLEPNPVPPL